MSVKWLFGTPYNIGCQQTDRNKNGPLGLGPGTSRNFGFWTGLDCTLGYLVAGLWRGGEVDMGKKKDLFVIIVLSGNPCTAWLDSHTPQTAKNIQLIRVWHLLRKYNHNSEKRKLKGSKYSKYSGSQRAMGNTQQAPPKLGKKDRKSKAHTL